MKTQIFGLFTMFIGFGIGYATRSGKDFYPSKPTLENLASGNTSLGEYNTAHSAQIPYSIDLPEDFKQSNLIAGTLLQLDSVCSDSVLHFSCFSGIATYGNGADYKHPIKNSLPYCTMFNIECVDYVCKNTQTNSFITITETPKEYKVGDTVEKFSYRNGGGFLIVSNIKFH